MALSGEAVGPGQELWVGCYPDVYIIPALRCNPYLTLTYMNMSTDTSSRMNTNINTDLDIHVYTYIVYTDIIFICIHLFKKSIGAYVGPNI